MSVKAVRPATTQKLEKKGPPPLPNGVKKATLQKAIPTVVPPRVVLQSSARSWIQLSKEPILFPPKMVVPVAKMASDLALSAYPINSVAALLGVVKTTRGVSEHDVEIIMQKIRAKKLQKFKSGPPDFDPSCHRAVRERIQRFQVIRIITARERAQSWRSPKRNSGRKTPTSPLAQLDKEPLSGGRKTALRKYSSETLSPGADADRHKAQQAQIDQRAEALQEVQNGKNVTHEITEIHLEAKKNLASTAVATTRVALPGLAGIGRREPVVLRHWQTSVQDAKT